MDWLLRPNGGTLALGGKLRSELSDDGRNGNFMKVYAQLRLMGSTKDVSDREVEVETKALEQQRVCQSNNDEHVLALARMSGARLLYSNDRALQDDFQDPHIINSPRGRVYTTLIRDDVTSTHQSLLNRADLCVD